MILYESQRSMRPLCLDLLLWLVDYIFVTCLIKSLSWLVRLSTCTNDFISSLIQLLFIISESFMKLWAVAWVVALKKWHRIRGRWLKTSWKSPTIGMSCCGSNWKASVTCMVCHGSGWGSKLVKFQVVSGVGHLEILVGSWRFCSCMCGRS